ncbi:MAG: hypothetical protein Q8920_07315 [Bacillota bacterium]|nr:hypothetical protein [Bacillota bacterium]
MNYSILYFFIIYVCFMLINTLLLQKSFSKNKPVTRAVLTLLSIAVSADLCFVFYNVGSVILSLSDNLQVFLKDTVGLVFIYRNKYFDYSFLLFLILILNYILYKIETNLRPAQRLNAVFISGYATLNRSRSIHSKLFIVNIICFSVTTLAAIHNFLF